MDNAPSLDPGSPRVRFGAEMRRLRLAAQLSQTAVARRLGCTQTQISRLESASRTPSKSDAERLDQLYGKANGISFTGIREHIIAQPGGPAWFWNWAEEIEPRALVIRSWDPLLVPGLLQTEAYARYLFSRGPQITSEELEQRVEARMQRQRILDQEDAPTLLALIDEGVLRRRIGNPELMQEQFGHLLETARRSAISIQVVDSECVAGLAGAFMIAELPNGEPDVVHSDSPAQGHITNNQDLVASIWKRYEAIRLWAYPEHISLKKIEEVKREWT
ncbi:helix-turn-helix transcriptional regulator [Streptosporangium sp. NPDC049644]|uniref:helix-turn-helix domain-containing protein n=1 Tax=Streptosporangium sp. NPDC049644 TaxID=3155507 RepID=UPI00343B0839